ncbi:MAG: imidazolonepropionase [Gemmatimonadales bacterium]|nr:MAG: imidazolonepropionase [Gemmatimonadales bacterium]
MSGARTIVSVLAALVLSAGVSAPALQAQAQAQGLIQALAPAQASTQTPAQAQAQAIIITNAEIHTISGEVIQGGTIVVEDGRITAVAPAGTAPPTPPNARTIDAGGRIVTPGFLESSTQLGIVAMGAEPGPADATVTNPRVTASFNVLDGFDPNAMAIPVTRIEGITRAIVRPNPGVSLIAGQGILVDLRTGDAVVERVHANPVGMFAVLGQGGSARAGGARGAATQQLREALQDARDHDQNRSAFEAGNRRDYAFSRLDLEAMALVLTGEIPLVVQVHRASDIRAALRMKEEFGIRLILFGALEGWMVADEIRDAGVPVVINPMLNLPGMESLGATLENAARLHEAGVTVALSSFDTDNARNLKQVAGNAVANGLPHDAALRAVTLTPAEIWGIEERFGSIEVGKEADLVIWSGDPFELDTRAEHVIIAGREIPLESRQIDLFNRYRTIGGPGGPGGPPR